MPCYAVMCQSSNEGVPVRRIAVGDVLLPSPGV
jgi:hypothetical protein